jgi:signal transduction histidine kinase
LNRFYLLAAVKVVPLIYYMQRGLSRLIYNIGYSIIALAIIGLSSCDKKYVGIDTQITKALQTADFLNLSGKTDSAEIILRHLRASITTANPAICEYYCYRAQRNFNNVPQMSLYADSALAYFNNDSRKSAYAEQYFKTLLVKGDVCMKTQKYINALNYYSNAKRIQPVNYCDEGILASKMGGIYYDQKHYTLSAKYWSECALRIRYCSGDKSALSIFYTTQGALNNAGFSYEKAGILDSAVYYYQLDLKLIDKADSDNVILKKNIANARAVVYDNLGGINLKQGKLLDAQNYLKKSIAIPNNIDGAHIPPLLKLAQLHMRLGQTDSAAECLNKGQALINKFGKDNPELSIKWNKLYAEYLVKIKQTEKAFFYQGNYISLRDSLEQKRSGLYRLDVDRELNTLQQQNTLIDLEQKNKIKVTYIAGVGIITVLSVIIILLTNRNLIRTRKDHHDAKIYNEQLENTLAELERVNQNYIRVMRVMAHDLRNPLSGMTGLATLLIDEDNFSEESKHMLKLIETTGTHSMEMINELLKSGLADETEQIAKQKLDIKSLLFDSVELLQFKAKEKNQQLVFESDNTPIIANINHEKIWRVFNNIIVNAIKFSYQSGIINIAIHHNQSKVFISVADNGIGVPDTDKHHIFEMFTPAKKAGTNGEQPFGLGLSISKKIIEKHNGKIWFESSAGIGTTFYIELPASN